MTKHALCILLSLASCTLASARTFYVAPDGHDDARHSDGAVFQTLRTAIDAAWGGDTVVLRKGEYEGGVHVRRGCTADAPLIIKGEPGSLIRGSGKERDGLMLDDCRFVIVDGVSVTGAARAGISTSHGSDVTLRNCHAYDNDRWGIFTDHTDNITVEGCECSGSRREHGIYHSNSAVGFIFRNNILHDNARAGIQLNGDPEYGGTGYIERGVIEGNLFYRNGIQGGAAINLPHVHDILIRNNVIYANKSAAITFYQDTGTLDQNSRAGLVIYNTIVFNPDEGRAPVVLGMSTQQFACFNNIIVSGKLKTAFEVNAIDLPSIATDYNLYDHVDPQSMVLRFDGSWTDPEGLVDHSRHFNGYLERQAIADRGKPMSRDEWFRQTGNDVNSKFGDPQFADAANSDFTLKTGSPAVGMAVTPKEIRRMLAPIGGFGGVLDKMDSLPDVDKAGKPRNADFTQRAIGAYEAE